MIKKIKFFLDKKHQLYCVFLFVGILTASVLEMIGIGSIPVFISFLLDPNRVFSYLPENNFITYISNKDQAYQIYFLGALLLTIFVFKNIFLFTVNYFQAFVFREIKITSSKRLFQNYLCSPYSEHLNRNPAVIVRDFFGQVHNACKFLDLIMICIREILIISAIFILLLLANPAMSLMIFLMVTIFIIIFNYFTKKKITSLSKLAQVHSVHQIKIINQVFGAIKDTKILNREDHFINEFNNETKGIERVDFFSKVISLIPRLSIEILGVITILFVTSFFVITGYSVDTMIPILGLLGVATVRLIPSFNVISGAIPIARRAYVSFDLVINELTSLEKYNNKRNNLEVTSKSEYKALNKAIEIKNISYEYPNSNKNILKNISFTIKSGSLFGIIGETGAGKSTLIDIILGLLEPSAGEINMDSKNIKENYRMWQKQIGYISQDIYIIDDTIRRNVAFGISDKDIDEESVKQSVKLAQLLDFTINLPQGLNTIVGNRGIRLSGGQRQRLGIARALYRKSKILILDEATSSLDIETEKNLINDIEGLGSEYTIIIVTHRLSTIKNCDDVILLSEGQLIDQGKFDDLTLRHKNLKTGFSRKKLLKK